MRTGAILAGGSCRALKWMALVGVVLALGTGDASAQRFNLDASASLTEGQSLVPVTVTFTAPAQPGRAQTSTDVVVTVRQIPVTDLSAQVEAIQQMMHPPLTRAELGAGAAGTAGESVDLTGANADVEWMPDSRADIAITNASGTATLTFTYGEGVVNLEHTAYLRTNRDSADAEDEQFQLVASSSGATPLRDKITVRIDDSQDQAYVVNFPGDNDMMIAEGMVAALEMEAVPDRTVSIPFNVTLSSTKDVTDYHLDSSPAAISQNYQLTITGGTRPDTDGGGTSDGTQPFTVNTSPSDRDREDDTVTVTVKTTNQAGGQRVLATFDLEVRDLHKLPKITLTKIQVPDADDKLQDAMSIPEGKVGTITLTADRSPDDVPDSEALKIMLSHVDSSTADTGDYTLNNSEVSFTATGTTATFKVDVDVDEDVGEESLMLMATLTGAETNGPNPDDPFELAAIPFGDTTATQISEKSYADIMKAVEDARTAGAGANGLWEPGEALTLGADDLFEYAAAAANVVLGNIVVEDPAVLSAATTNDMVTVTAVGEGESPISITGTVVGMSSLDVTQTTSNVVTVKFPITVDAPMITAKDNVQAVAVAAVAKAAEASANGIWEPAPNGAVAMVAVSDLFDVPESIKAEYLSRSSDNADVMAAISGDMMNVELTPTGAGMATITVTAVDTERPGSAVSVEFDVTVMAQAAVRALSQDEVDAVFEAAGAGDLVAQGASITLDASDLFEVGPGVAPGYSSESSDMDVLMASTSGMMLTLTPGQGPAGGMSTVTVTALDSASGSHASVMYMATVNALPAMITVSTDPMDMVEEGRIITVTAMLNQKAPHDKAIAVQVTGPATPKEAEIMLVEGMESASVMLMADDDYDPMSDWNDIVIVASHEAIMGGSAVMTLSVTENDSEITYTLSGPDDMNLVEGEEYELTVMAEPAVLMDTEVMVMRDRANSDADEDDYTVDPIMIMAGETSVSAMLMVEDDGPGDAGHGDPEELTLYGMVGNMQTNSVSFYLWDAAVPALPVIAQLLLAAFLAVGGYRRYYRRR